MRFALLEAKVGLAATVRKFSFSRFELSGPPVNDCTIYTRSERTVEKPELDPTSTLGYVKNGLWATVRYRAGTQSSRQE